jgi:hypothetical protein
LTIPYLGIFFFFSRLTPISISVFISNRTHPFLTGQAIRKPAIVSKINMELAHAVLLHANTLLAEDGSLVSSTARPAVVGIS